MGLRPPWGRYPRPNGRGERLRRRRAAPTRSSGSRTRQTISCADASPENSTTGFWRRRSGRRLRRRPLRPQPLPQPRVRVHLRVRPLDKPLCLAPSGLGVGLAGLMSPPGLSAVTAAPAPQPTESPTPSILWRSAGVWRNAAAKSGLRTTARARQGATHECSPHWCCRWGTRPPNFPRAYCRTCLERCSPPPYSSARAGSDWRASDGSPEPCWLPARRAPYKNSCSAVPADIFSKAFMHFVTVVLFLFVCLLFCRIRSHSPPRVLPF